MSKCLYCYEEVDASTSLSKGNGKDFQERCSLEFFGTVEPPSLDYTMDEMAELAKNVIENSVAVPGVQPKLSLGFINEVLNERNHGRLTVLAH